jgi:protein-arginine kinase activator protein McsA
MQQFKKLLFLMLFTSACNMIAMDHEQPTKVTTVSKKRALEYICFHCNEAFEDAVSLATHQHANHPTKHNVRIPAYIIAQQKAQKDLPDLQCQFCPSSFKERGILDFHIRNDHHRCTLCFEQFKEGLDSYFHTKEKHPETIVPIKSDDEIRKEKREASQKNHVDEKHDKR